MQSVFDIYYICKVVINFNFRKKIDIKDLDSILQKVRNHYNMIGSPLAA